MRRILTVCALALVATTLTVYHFAPSSAATTINVPADYPAIQLAINAAADGDEVVVAPGTYFENLDFGGKAIVVRSVSGAATTTIDGSANLPSGPIVTFDSGETSDSVLDGFTLTRGDTGVHVAGSAPTIVANRIHRNSAGITVHGGSPVIRSNIISLNSSAGGILVIRLSSPLIEGNVIENNSALLTAGGITIERIDPDNSPAVSSAIIRNNIIRGNITQGFQAGGAIWLNGTSGELIVQNVIQFNSAQRAGVVMTFTEFSVPPRLIQNTLQESAAAAVLLEGYPKAVRVTNNIIVGEGPKGIDCGLNTASPPAIITFNNAFSAQGFAGACATALGVNGNITEDPQFVLAPDELQLSPGSPSRNSGDSSAPNLPLLDIDGDPRIAGPAIDQGAYEFQESQPDPTATSTFSASSTPTSTVTLSTNTPTPGGPAVEKIPDGNENNTDLAIPAANLWICETGSCAGPGEGALRVIEHASNVHSDTDGDDIPDGIDPCVCTGVGPDNEIGTADDTNSVAPAFTDLGLGAYEFSVEYDNFVIESVNPCDIVFGTGSPPGAGANRGPVEELPSSAINPDCFAPPGSPTGSCAMSIILENIVHFGCVTAGTNLGPTGDMDLASLLLIPHPDLRDDLFPGNNNGVVTIIKDNGCELVDILGHPVHGSINGGLTPYCRDLSVTVRILEGDLDLNCLVDLSDAQAIAARYGAFFGGLLYNKWYDLEPQFHDLDIDIKDVQKVFGRQESTCDTPIPPQPPVPFNG